MEERDLKDSLMKEREGSGDPKVSTGMSQWLVRSLTERERIGEGGTEEGHVVGSRRAWIMRSVLDMCDLRQL